MYQATIHDLNGQVLCVCYSGWVAYMVYQECARRGVSVRIKQQHI